MAPNEELEKKVEEFEKDQNSPKSNKKKKKSAWKYVLNICLVLIITVAAVIITVWGDFDKIMNQLAKCDWRWLLVVFGLMLLAVLIRGIILFSFARLYTRRYKYHQALAVDQIGVFYNAVTPGASGGQVMQAYTYKKQGIPVSSAVSILAMYSIVFQIVLIIYGIVSFIVKYDAITSIGDIPFNIGGWSFTIPIWPLTIIGFLLNLGVIAIVLLMGYWKGFHNFIMGPCISFFAKIKIIKNPDKKRENLRISVENFKIELRRLFSNVPFTILVFFLFFCYITTKYSIPFFVGKSMGNQSTCASFWDAIFLSNYHQMVTGLIPIPGAAGVSEYFFSKLFTASKATAESSFFFKAATQEEIMKVIEASSEPMEYGAAKTIADTRASNSLCSACLLVWRSITFIIPLVISGFVTAFYHASPKEEAETNDDVLKRETFVNLQNATYDERVEEMETMIETSRLTREAILSKLKSSSKTKETKTKGEKVQEYDDVTVTKEKGDLE